MAKLIDLTGQKFGEWTVLKKGERKNNITWWICECSCGTIKPVPRDMLIKKKSQSCGCKRSEILSEKFADNLIGKKFGMLTVLKRGEHNKNLRRRRVVWECLCDCGNIILTTADSLKYGHKISCGCLSSSIGEFTIEKILKENNITYKKEYSFDDLRGKNNRTPLRFDFAIFNQDNKLSYLIEYDGRQHFKDQNNWNDKDDSFENRINRDQLKNEYCMKNNIKLVRINYKEEITKEKIILCPG